MRLSPPTPFLFALSCALPLAAQRTWIVDAAGGTGADFRDLPPAVAAAADGDTIAVRAGTYSPTTIAKTLVVLGESGVSLSKLTIGGLPADKVVVVKRLTVSTVDVTGNAGRVHLERVFAFLPFIVFPNNIRNTRLVTANDCGFTGLNVAGSTVVLTSSSVSAPQANALALDLAGADVTLTDCTVRGANASCAFGQSTPGQAIRTATSMLRIAGDRTRIAAGSDDAQCTSHPPVAAILCDGSSVIRLDATASVAGTNGGAPIAGECATSTARLPAVTAAGAPPGQVVFTDTHAPAGSLSVLLLGLAGVDLPTPFGAIWVGLGHIDIDAGAIGPSEHRVFPLVVQPHWPRGLAVAVQAATLSPQGALALSHPVAVVFD